MKDLMGLMKQAQAMQSKMADMQAELENREVEGVSGGGLVRLRLSAKGVMKGLSIDPSLMTADDREVLEDLIVAAHNEARARAEAESAEAMQKITAGLPLPPGFKMPF